MNRDADNALFHGLTTGIFLLWASIYLIIPFQPGAVLWTADIAIVAAVSVVVARIIFRRGRAQTWASEARCHRCGGGARDRTTRRCAGCGADVDAFLAALQRRRERKIAKAPPTHATSLARPADVLLTRFCVCGYDQFGLPPTHRCPECGAQIDEHTRIWRPSRRLRNPLTFGGLALTWALCSLGCNFCILTELVGIPFGLSFLLIALIGAGVLLFFWLRNTSLGRPFVAVMPDGIRGRTAAGSFFVEWQDLGTVAMHDTHPWFSRRDGNLDIHLGGVLDTNEAREEFAAAVSYARQRAFNAPQQPPIR